MPLAAWATTRAFRAPAIVLSAVVGLILMPRGADFGVFQIIEAAGATVVVGVGFILLTRNRLPWRDRTGVSASSQPPAAYGVTS